MDNDFEEYDNEMDDEMDSEDGEDNRSGNYIEESDVSRDEPIDNAKDIGECLKVEVESDIEDGGHQFTCETCLQTFELAEHLVDHVKTAHADEKPESLDCQTCQKSFLTKQWLSRHIRKEHTTKPEQNIPEKPREKHQCHICKKELFFEKILKNHIEKEHDQENYQCSHCPKSYITKSKFKLHQSIAHTSIKYNIDPSKQEMCEICSKIFCNAKRLRQHIISVPKDFLTLPIFNSTLMQSTGVNFINILRTKFSYKHRFGSFFYVTREKAAKTMLVQKIRT